MSKFSLCVLALAALMFCQTAHAQISLLSDGEGRSSIVQEFAASDKRLSASVSDKTIAYYGARRKPLPSTQLRYFAGYQFGAGGQNGRLPELKGGLTNFEVSASCAWYQFICANNTYDYFYLMPSARAGRVRTFFPPSPEDPLSLDMRNTFKGSLQVGFNSLSICGSDLFLGVAADFGYDDNIERLESLQYGISKYAGVDIHNNPVFVTDNTKYGYINDEIDRGMFVTWLADVGFSFHRFQVVIHPRVDSYAGDGKKFYFSPGTGLYYTKRHDPAKVLCGLQASVEDYSNVNLSTEPRAKRIKIGLVLGFDL